MNNSKSALPIREAAILLGRLSMPKIYEEINSGRLKTFRIGRRRYVSDTALAQYIADREADSTAPNS